MTQIRQALRNFILYQIFWRQAEAEIKLYYEYSQDVALGTDFAVIFTSLVPHQIGFNTPYVI